MNAHGKSCLVCCVPRSWKLPASSVTRLKQLAPSLQVMTIGPDSVASTRPVSVAPHVTFGWGWPNAPIIQGGAQPPDHPGRPPAAAVEHEVGVAADHGADVHPHQHREDVALAVDAQVD